MVALDAAGPTGRSLAALPSAVWDSYEVRMAAAHDSPGEVIAIARRAHGLSQAQLGGLAGFSQSAISRIESGGNLAFDLRMLRVFQRVLGIPAHLLGLAQDAFPVPLLDAQRLQDQIGRRYRRRSAARSWPPRVPPRCGPRCPSPRSA